MDTNTRTNLNTQYNRDKLISVFPDLMDDVNFEILSPETPKYNCIAWAMQFEDRWVDVVDGPGFWWPNGVEKTMLPSDLIHAFEAVGFTLCANSHLEDGFDKVVLYKKEDSEEWTHAARIISDTMEYSKFGQSWDGTHSRGVLCKTGIGYENFSYGVPYAFMKRSKIYELPKEKLIGKIEVDFNLLSAFLKMKM